MQNLLFLIGSVILLESISFSRSYTLNYELEELKDLQPAAVFLDKLYDSVQKGKLI